MNEGNKSGKFLSVIELNKGILYKIANSYCKNSEDQKDLIQEIISQLWRSFDRYDNQYMYSTWIYRIALNVAISFYRKETRRKELNYPITDSILNVDDKAVVGKNEDDLNLLLQFIGELKELDKALILLYLDEKSHKEIADIIGISETNVATKISRIKTVLKQKFLTANSN